MTSIIPHLRSTFVPAWLNLAVAQGMDGTRVDWHGTEMHWSWETVRSAMGAVEASSRRFG